MAWLSPPPLPITAAANSRRSQAEWITMIKGFQPTAREESRVAYHFQWVPAIAAGLIAGVVLLILPHASPWEGLTVFTPTIVGRQVPASWEMQAFSIVVIHLALSLVYGIIISLAVINVRQLRALLVGAAVGLLLYALNLLIVSIWIPAMRTDEVPVLITHFVFGLVAAGAYRGLLRRPAPAGVS